MLARRIAEGVVSGGPPCAYGANNSSGLSAEEAAALQVQAETAAALAQSLALENAALQAAVQRLGDDYR